MTKGGKGQNSGRSINKGAFRRRRRLWLSKTETEIVRSRTNDREGGESKESQYEGDSIQGGKVMGINSRPQNVDVLKLKKRLRRRKWDTSEKIEKKEGTFFFRERKLGQRNGQPGLSAKPPMDKEQRGEEDLTDGIQ